VTYIDPGDAGRPCSCFDFLEDRRCVRGVAKAEDGEEHDVLELA
jgi:hypothetical protein